MPAAASETERRKQKGEPAGEQEAKNREQLARGDAVWLGVFGQIGLGILALPCFALWRRRQARRTCYLLTSKRAVIFLPNVFGKLTVVSYQPEQLQHLRFEPSQLFGRDAGDVVFRKNTTIKTTHYITEGRMESATSVELFGFLMLNEGQPMVHIRKSGLHY